MLSMSLRTSVFHMLPAQSAKPAMRRAFHFLPPSAPKSAAPLRSQTPPAGSFVMSRAATASKPRFQLPQRSLLFAGVGLGATWAAYNAFQPVHCDVALPASSSSSSSSALNASDPAPGSILDVYQLGFGAACGVCAGVFLKKGLKAIAFMLGGAYVLLQYMSNKSLVSVDWARMSQKYDSMFGTSSSTVAQGKNGIAKLYARVADFLTANFQQRASFLAGLALGFRLG